MAGVHTVSPTLFQLGAGNAGSGGTTMPKLGRLNRATVQAVTAREEMDLDFITVVAVVDLMGAVLGNAYRKSNRRLRGPLANFCEFVQNLTLLAQIPAQFGSQA